MTEIKQIRTYTLSDKDVDCASKPETVDFLTNVLFNERDGHFHYINNPIKLPGKTLILFKYKGKLIAKGIFLKRVDEEEMCNGYLYPGYYQVQNGSVVIFNEEVDLETLNEYLPVKSLTRDQIFHIRYKDKISEMINDFTN